MGWTLHHSGERELQRDTAGCQWAKTEATLQILETRQNWRNWGHRTLSRVTCVWGSISLKNKRHILILEDNCSLFQAGILFYFLLNMVPVAHAWEVSHTTNISFIQQAQNDHCSSYLRQSQVTSRWDSVILKMLWMALAARICLMVSEMTSTDSAVFTSMEPRKRTIKSWWRIESAQHKKQKKQNILHVRLWFHSSCVKADSLVV